MDILGLGVLLTGESGLGKSELGLELISRGHGLVADDAVDLYRITQTTLEGRCPELLHEPARSARHRPARHQGDLRRDGGAPEDAPEADRPPGAQGNDGARVRAPALRAAHAGRARRAGAQGRDRGRSPAATSPCWSRRRCATPSCSCAASTPTRSSSSATAGRWSRTSDAGEAASGQSRHGCGRPRCARPTACSLRPVRAVLLGALRVQAQRMVLQLEAACVLATRCWRFSISAS